MQLDSDKVIEQAIRDGIREGIKDRLTKGYNSPLDTVINDSIQTKMIAFRGLLEESIASCLNSKDFREEIASSIRSSLARTLVQRFGGEIEKQVNALKSDPTTRARITLAVEEIVKSHGH